MLDCYTHHSPVSRKQSTDGGQSGSSMLMIMPLVISLSFHGHSKSQHATRKHNKAQDVIIMPDRKSTRLNSSHGYISYAVFCLKKKKQGGRSETRRSKDAGDEPRRPHPPTATGQPRPAWPIPSALSAVVVCSMDLSFGKQLAPTHHHSLTLHDALPI